MQIENVKGTYDYAKDEQIIREKIKDSLKKLFKKYGYSPIETPLICYFDLLTAKYEEEDEIVKEVYKVTDRGNRKLGLRYDLTVPFAKFIALEKNLRLPFKRYEIGDAFRDGPVKVGRDRQFVQCDVDVVGLDNQEIEAELISLFIKGCKELNIPVEVQYNNRKLMQGIIESLGVEPNKISSIIKIVDKIKKINEEELRAELFSLDVDAKNQELLLKYFKMNFLQLEASFKNTDIININSGLAEIKKLKELIDYLGLTNQTKFVPSLVRGQEYYTGNVFEAYAINSQIKSSIGGGGRYDKMITEWINDGKAYPAVGISFGLSVIYEIIKNREESQTKSLVDIYIIPMGTNKESLKLADDLREISFNVEVEMQSQKLKKCFEYANREKIPYVIVLGENELTQNSFKIKDMLSGEEKSIFFDKLEVIQSIIKR